MVDRYFPTEELEGVPTAPDAAAIMAEALSGSQPLAIGEETGLPFIGYTYKRLYEKILPFVMVFGFGLMLTLLAANISPDTAVYDPGYCLRIRGFF